VPEIIKNLKKDIKIEFRNRSALNLALAFALISTLTISLIIGGVPLEPKKEAIILWLIIFFSAISSLAYTFIREEEKKTILFLRLNFSAESVYFSKLIFNIFFFFIIQIIVAIFYVFFRQLEIQSLNLFILGLLGGGLALASTITILGAMVAKANGQSSLLAVISFPLLLPVLWMAVSSTTKSLTPNPFSSNPVFYNEIYFLLAFSGIMIAGSFIFFKFIWSSQ